MSAQVILKNGLILLQARPAESTAQAAKNWSTMYHDYARELRAGGVMTPIGLNKEVIESQLMLVTSGDFFVRLGNAIALYWSTAIWVSPGFTGTTTSANGLVPLLFGASEKIKNHTSQEVAINELSTAFQSHSAMITILMVNTVSGVSSIVSTI